MKLLLKKILLHFILWMITAVTCAGEMKIIFTADLHGRLLNYASLAPAIRKEADKNSIILDIGDTVTGIFSVEFSENGSGMAEAMKLVGTTIWVPGNHDFEMPDENFLAFIQRFNGSVLGADWQKAGLSGKPFVIVERGGIRCAIIGLTDPGMSIRNLPGSGMSFSSPMQTLKRIMPKVRAEHPHLIVLAIHSGIYFPGGNLHKLLRTFPDINVVLGAHTHQETPGQRLGDTIFVQSGAYGKAAGVVEVKSSRDNRITSITSRLIRSKRENPDRALLNLNRNLEKKSRSTATKKLGEFTLQNFGSRCAEIIREHAGTDAGAIWINTPPFKETALFINYRRFFNIFPFRDHLCSITVTRDEMNRFIAEQEKMNRKRQYQRQLFVSGIKLNRSKRCAPGTPASFSLATSGFSITSSRVLRPLVWKRQRNFRIVAPCERDVISGVLIKNSQP